MEEYEFLKTFPSLKKISSKVISIIRIPIK